MKENTKNQPYKIEFEWNSAAVKFKNRVSVLWNAGVHEDT